MWVLQNPHENLQFAPKIELHIRVYTPQMKILGPPLMVPIIRMNHITGKVEHTCTVDKKNSGNPLKQAWYTLESYHPTPPHSLLNWNTQLLRISPLISKVLYSMPKKIWSVWVLRYLKSILEHLISHPPSSWLAVGCKMGTTDCHAQMVHISHSGRNTIQGRARTHAPTQQRERERENQFPS